MTVLEAYEFLRELIAKGKGDLLMYTEYQRVYQMQENIADECCDGSSIELEPGTLFVRVDLDH